MDNSQKELQLMDSTDFSTNLTRLHNLDQRKIVVASKGELIALCDNKKFLEAYYSLLVFHQIPQPERIEPVIQTMAFISDNFQWCTLEDFKLAFELNAAAKLNNKHNPFKSFDNMFIGNVLADYKEKRNETMAIWMRISQPVADVSKQLVSHQSNVDYLQEIYLKDIENAKKGNYRAAILLGSRMFEWLYSSSTCSDDSWTEAEWQLAKNNARKNLHDEQEIGNNKLQRIKSNERMYLRYKEDLLIGIKRELYLIHLKKQK